MVVVALEGAFIQPVLPEVAPFVVVELLFLHTGKTICAGHDVMARRRRASSPSSDEVGGRFVDFEPFRGVPRSRGSRETRRLSDDHEDGVAAT